jgi:hypothetical protein
MFVHPVVAHELSRQRQAELRRVAAEVALRPSLLSRLRKRRRRLANPDELVLAA